MVLLKFETIKHPKFTFYTNLTQAIDWLCTVQQWVLNLHLSRKEVTMTSNQIAYFKAKIEEEHYGRSDAEQARSNRANEALKAYQTSVDEAHYLRSDAENVRANKAREQENYRSNRAKEDIEWSQIPSKNAERWSNVSKNYADVGLKNAQTQSEYRKQELTQAQTSLTNQEAATEWLRQNNVRADTRLKDAQTENTETNTYWADMYAMSSVLSGFGNFFKGAGSAITSGSSLTGGKSNETGKPLQTGKQSRRWQEGDFTFTQEFYNYAQ